MSESGPNVVFVVIDSLRWDHCGFNGYERETTPFLSSLCKNDAVRYNNCFGASTWTPPSHASMFTGRYVSEHGYVDSLGDINHPLLAEVLGDAGYRTVSVVPTPNLGDREPLSRGFEDCYEKFRAHPRTLGQLKDGSVPKALKQFGLYYWGHFDAFSKELLGRLDVNDDDSIRDFQTGVIENYLNSMSGGGHPFLLFTNFGHPHSNYYPDEAAIAAAPFDIFDPANHDMDRLRELAQGHELYRYMVGEVEVSDEEWAALKDWYDINIYHADQQVRSVVEALKATGEFENTMLVVTADHGEHFGEKRRALHSFSLYDELLHVPLVIKYPDGMFAGETVDELVSHVDLVETICETVDVAAPETDGRLLPPLGTNPRDHILAEYAENISGMSAMGKYTSIEPSEDFYDKLFTDLQCVRTESAKYIRRDDGQSEFYRVDTGGRVEEIDAISTDKPEVERLAGLLERSLDDLPDIAAIAPDHPEAVVEQAQQVREVDAVEEQRLRDLGYM